jgi:hypothetical protein
MHTHTHMHIHTHAHTHALVVVVVTKNSDSRASRAIGTLETKKAYVLPGPVQQTLRVVSRCVVISGITTICANMVHHSHVACQQLKRLDTEGERRHKPNASNPQHYRITSISPNRSTVVAHHAS